MDSTEAPSGWVAPQVPAAAGEPLVGLGPRFGALLVDAVVYWLLMIGPYLVLEGIVGESWRDGGSYLLVFGGAFAYFTLLWALNDGKTVGMRAAGIRVVRRRDGAPIGLGRAAIRTVGLFITLAFWFISLLAVLVSKRSPADALAGTSVVKAAS